MNTSKVIYAGDTLIDLTNDTVTADTLAEGVTAHDAAGNLITGTMKSGGGSLEWKYLSVPDDYSTVTLDMASYNYSLEAVSYGMALEYYFNLSSISTESKLMFHNNSGPYYITVPASVATIQATSKGVYLTVNQNSSTGAYKIMVSLPFSASTYTTFYNGGSLQFIPKSSGVYKPVLTLFRG